jgi:tRNA pseudouridine38-40 synthase
MRNIKLTVAYQGTAYSGWQVQPNGPSIQAKLKDAVFAITGERVTIYGSGRTDAGVHAAAQVANFFTQARMPAERFAPALNTRLPADIRVLDSVEVPAAFNSRFDARGKTYAYRIDRSPVASPFFRELSWHVPGSLDLEAMKAASRVFLGEHDFRGFMASGSSIKTTVRRIDAVTFDEGAPLLTITYIGSGFLYKMVRILTGTLVMVGQGRIAVADLPAILESRDRAQAGITAPAAGLMLMAVAYPETDIPGL